MTIWKSFDDFKSEQLCDIEPYPECDWLEPKDIYMHDDKYKYEMKIDPDIKKYIDEIVDKKIKKIKKELVFTTEETLIDFWDNKYDEQWNDY